jgi:hypothetical protein
MTDPWWDNYTASCVVQIGSSIVHCFKEDTASSCYIYAMGDITSFGKQGKVWVTYDDGEFSHQLLPDHYGRVWAFVESLIITPSSQVEPLTPVRPPQSLACTPRSLHLTKCV